MNLRWIACAVCATALVACSRPQEAERGDFIPIFDGRTLAGWRTVPEGYEASWSVQDGALRGEGQEDRLVYLVYEDDQDLSDFEFRFSYRMLTEGNTGVEVRARSDQTGKRPFEGYHADLGHAGIGPQILGAWDLHFAAREEFPCERGSRLLIDASGIARHEPIDDPATLDDILPGGWNQCLIAAKGNRLRFFINGKLSSEFVDGIEQGRLDSGLIALQLHDEGMRVEFKDLELKR